jgi:hypothetical protein
VTSSAGTRGRFEASARTPHGQSGTSSWMAAVPGEPPDADVHRAGSQIVAAAADRAKCNSACNIDPLMAFNLSFLFARTDLLHAAVNDLTAWVEAGSIQVPKVRSIGLADVAQAHRTLESGETTGKLVLRTASALGAACEPPHRA